MRVRAAAAAAAAAAALLHNALSNIGCVLPCPVQVGSRVVSMSLGGYGHSRLGAEAIEALGRNGTLVVAAAGNDGADVATDAYFPASLKLDNVISGEHPAPMNVCVGRWAAMPLWCAGCVCLAAHPTHPPRRPPCPAAVAASTAADELAYFSNWGAHIGEQL